LVGTFNLTQLQINKYIKRIGFKENLEANIECLKKLHLNHVMSIPFEALDVYSGNRINLGLDKIFHKIIESKRGGYCYELNYLFHWLLTHIGFEAHFVSVRIFDEDKYGPEYDHLALIVKLDSSWLVDVGYGDLFVEPIKIAPEVIQEDRFKLYKLEKINDRDYLLLESLKTDIKWTKRYIFSTRSCSIQEFEDQNEYKQSSSESYFVKNRICTMPTLEGRKTILNNVFKIKANNIVHKKEILSAKEMIQILDNEFGIRINGAVS